MQQITRAMQQITLEPQAQPGSAAPFHTPEQIQQWQQQLETHANSCEQMQQQLDQVQSQLNKKYKYLESQQPIVTAADVQLQGALSSIAKISNALRMPAIQSIAATKAALEGELAKLQPFVAENQGPIQQFVSIHQKRRELHTMAVAKVTQLQQQLTQQSEQLLTAQQQLRLTPQQYQPQTEQLENNQQSLQQQLNEIVHIWD